MDHSLTLKPPELPRPPVHVAWSYFLKAYKAVVDRVDKEVRAGSDVSLAEFELLSVLVRALGRMRFIDLAKTILLSQSRISRQIDVLQAKGLIVREVSQVDRRAIFAQLTPAGYAAFEAALPSFRKAYAEEFTTLIGPENLKAFGDALSSLLRDPDYTPRMTEIVAAARQANTPEAGGDLATFATETHRSVWIYFLRAYKAVVDRVDAAVRQSSDLSLAEYELLSILMRAGGRIRFIDLAKVTLLSQSRISRQIDALQAKGFITRETTQVDRRATYARLTPAGQAAHDKARPPFLRSYAAEFADLVAPEDLQPFTDTLHELLKEPDYERSFRAIIDAAREANLAADLEYQPA